MIDKNIYCIIGMTGSGKSTLLDSLLQSAPEDLDIGNLIYHTTRRKRDNEKDGVDYYFTDENEYNKCRFADELIESRHYQKYDESVYYYTTKSDICDNPSRNILCAASVDQAISYYNMFKDKVHIIMLNVSVKERLQRLIERADNDNDIKEACRRIIEEENEFARINDYYQKDLISSITINNSVKYIHKSYNEFSDEYKYILKAVFDFIRFNDKAHIIN